MERLKLLRPRRKHPTAVRATEGGVATYFLFLVRTIVGPSDDWTPFGYTPTRQHVFTLEGREGARALWMDQQEFALEPEAGIFAHPTSFLLYRADLPFVVIGELVSYAWDGHLYARQTGDDSVLEMPARRRYAERDRRNEELARNRDHARVEVVPRASSDRLVAGYPLSDWLERIA